MAKKSEDPRKAFEAGKSDRWSAGEYGCKVKVFVKSGKLKMSYQHPDTGRPKQRTLFGAVTPDLRKRAAAIALKKSEELRAGVAAQIERLNRGWEELSIFDVAHLYMQRAPDFPAWIFDAEERGKSIYRAVVEWHEALPPAVKNSPTTPSPKTLYSDVYAFRRIFQHALFPRTRKLCTLEPADATNYAAQVAAKGGSPRTPVNDMDRLSCAIRWVQTQYRKTYGIPYNPLDGRVVDRTRAEIDMYTEEETRKLVAAARAGKPSVGYWQVHAVIRIARSGRRVSSMLALTAADHDLTRSKDAPHGWVMWRAEEAKGKAYGRGDQRFPMTALHREAVDWLLEHRPNPMGAEYPLIYRVRNPTLPVLEQFVDKQLKVLETTTGVEHKPGRAFHGFCRSVITVAADKMGDGPAAEFTARKVETIRRYSYKKTTPAKMGETAGALDLEES